MYNELCGQRFNSAYLLVLPDPYASQLSLGEPTLSAQNLGALNRSAQSLGALTLRLNAKLSLNWTGPWHIKVVGPNATAPDNQPVSPKLLSLNFPTNESESVGLRKIVFVVLCCKPCQRTHDEKRKVYQLELVHMY